MTSEMGVEYAEGDDYTLTYYQVVEDTDGEPIEVEIAPENIKDVGNYTVVAIPTRNGVLSGEAWARFEVVERQIIRGDANLDGKLDIRDVTEIQRHVASFITLEGSALLAADIDGDGDVDIQDATLIQRKLAEFEDTYGIGEILV